MGLPLATDLLSARDFREQKGTLCRLAVIRVVRGGLLVGTDFVCTLQKDLCLLTGIFELCLDSSSSQLILSNEP